jgi:pimeloyl-ACP methyl ester carboxylesterase
MALLFITPTTADATPVRSIAWGACADPTLAAGGAECGTLDVPLDHGNPGGKQITLAVSRVKHKTTVARGTVLAVPNPLGGDGYLNSLRGARVAGGDAFDWVGFARRGIAPSVPAISCVPDHITFNRPNYVPTTPALEQEWLNRTKAYANACTPGDLLDHMKTTDVVADMELVRKALGNDKVMLYGQAYGTYVAQVYATLHANRVQRMVLDSTVDPRRIWYDAANFDLNAPLQRNLGIWFEWLASHNDVYHLGTTKQAVQQVWDAQVRRVSTQPAAGAVGQPEWIDLFLFTAYTQQTWTLLGSAFANWVNNGDGETIKALFAQFYLNGSDNIYGSLLAEVCTDTAWPTNWNRWRVDSWVSHAQAPDTTWGNTWFNAPCAFWKAKPGKPVTVNGANVDSALLVGETLDAAVPFEGSLEVRSRFPRASLVAVQGGVNYANSLTGNACVDTKISAYLATGELPARKPGRQADVLCAPLPAPSPTG